MKKILAATIASALLIPALSTSAFAGDEYPGTVNTSTTLKAPRNVDRNEQFEVKIGVKTASGRPAATRAAGPCKGKLVVTISKGTKKAKVRSESTSGGSKTYKFKLGSLGAWKIKGRFVPNDSSPCKASSKTRTITVS